MISAVIHTYNEEKNIERCLKSLFWVDEIIVIDMYSKDKTCEIVKSYHVKLYHHPYTGFVEPARNFGIQKAKGNWILIVDADEEIPKSLADLLMRTLQFKTADYYRLPRKNIIFGKWVKNAGWWPDYQVRFFKKGYVFWNDKIHGVPLTKGYGEDIDISESLSITHYNYQNISQYIDRLNRYTTISARELLSDKKNIKFRDIIEKPLNEFINRYFIWQGYKDGLHGLALSLLQSFSELINYLKLWELRKYPDEKINLEDIDEQFKHEYRLKQYWIITELLKQPKNMISNTVLRAKRKLFRTL